MTFLAPAGAVFLAAIPLIVAYHFLRIRRREVPLGTNFLWEQALRERQVRRPWRRFRASFLLALQILAALLGALAIMRPATATAGTLSPDTVIVLQASASMQTTDVAPSRFAVAKQRAQTMIDEMGDGDRVTLITMGAHPAMLAQSTGATGPLTAALAAAQPDGGSPDIDSALAIAAAVGNDSNGINVVIIGDGLVPAPTVAASQPFPISFIKVGASGDDVGITLLQAGASGHVTATLSNWSGVARTDQVKLEADGALVDVRSFTVPAHAARDVDLTAPATATQVKASLATSDALALDNVAYALLPPSHRLTIQLVTARNVFLERALQLRSDVVVNVVTPENYSPTAAADADVFDGYSPAALPAVPYLLVNPPSGLAGSGDAVVPHQLEAHSLGDPLLADVGLADVHISSTHDLSKSAGVPVIDSDAGPILLTQDKPRSAVLGFDVHNSDLPIKPAFPLLISHLSRFLLPPATDLTHHATGSPVSIPAQANTTTVVVTDPQGAATTLPVVNGAAVYVGANVAGVYTVEQQGSGPAVSGAFAVSGTALTSLMPRELPALSALQPPHPSETRWVDRWQWLIVLLLLTLSAEWWVFHRG